MKDQKVCKEILKIKVSLEQMAYQYIHDGKHAVNAEKLISFASSCGIISDDEYQTMLSEILCW